MTAQPTVSIIVPAFNYGRFIAGTIESVQAQTLTDWECLVVDKSTDDTADIVAAIAADDARVRYVRQADSGLSAARNAGLRATSGRFVQFLDADDLIGPGKLERQAEILESRPEVDLVYGEARYFRDATAESPRVEWERKLSTFSGAGEPLLAALLRENIMVVQAPLIRRPLLERVGGFDPNLPTIEDWDCWIRCALAGAVFQYDAGSGADCRSYVRVHGASMSSDQIAMHETAVRIREDVESKLPSPELRRLNRRRIHEQWAVIGMLEGLGDHLGSGMRHLLKAGLAERRITWLAWGVLMPLVRRPPGSWAMHRLRAFRARRRGEEVRDWQAHRP
jgi:glycosyltransferase involved in cell wall biosynthesis